MSLHTLGAVVLYNAPAENMDSLCSLKQSHKKYIWLWTVDLLLSGAP